MGPSSLSPIESWKPWQPSAADPWNRKWAGHLYRRAAFGASPKELRDAERDGFERTFERLMQGRSDSDVIDETIQDVGRVAAGRDNAGEQLRGWWIYAMLRSPHPLREKLTLFWHNHFATSIAKVQSPDLMLRQNQLLRTHALAKFGPLLQAISKDGAMLLWLDSNSNLKDHPNENYGRELLELFSLGVGNYTEKDIREAARAFTGWQVRENRYVFRSVDHDNGTKTVFGQTGHWNGEDVVRIVLNQPAVARFIVRKLYRFLINENTAPTDAFLQPLDDAFRSSDYDIKQLVRTMLASRHFFSDAAFRQRVKSPVEYVLGAVRTVCETDPDGAGDAKPIPHQALVAKIDAMGQQLFAPPNVKGWAGGRDGLNTATLLERANFANSLAMGLLFNATNHGVSAAEITPPPIHDAARIIREAKTETPDDVVRVLIDVYLPGGVRPAVRSRLVEFVADGRPTGTALDRRVREVVHAIMSMPEYQLA